MTKRIVALLFLPLMLQACRSPAAPDQLRVIGIIDFHGESTSDVLSAADTVEAGATFEVTVTTYGGGCDRAAGAVLQTVNNQADITVYDLTPSAEYDYECPAIINRMPRTVAVRFAEPGLAVLRVHGRKLDFHTDSRATIAKTIIVQ